MLEHDGALECWTLAALPSSWAAALGIDGGASSDVVDAVRLPDHRLAYLDYEGPVSNNRGEVCRCDGGEYQWLDAGPSPMRLELCGAVLKGLVVLTLIDDDRWQVDATPTLNV